MNSSLALRHRIHYHYDRAILLGPHLIRLCPTAHSRLPTRDYELTITPTPQTIHWQEDSFGNSVARVVFSEKARDLTVVMKAVIDWVDINPLDFLLDRSVEHWPFSYDSHLLKSLTPYLEVSANGARFETFMSDLPCKSSPTVAFLAHLNHYIAHLITYTTRLETGIQTCDATLAQRTGACRDSAWLLIQVARQLGLAARFVSGYLIERSQSVDPTTTGIAPRSDSMALHAWVDIYLPGAGWIGLDPTSGLFAGPGYLPLVCVPDPIFATPIEGTCEPSSIEWDYTQTVERIPRHTPGNGC